MSPTFPYSVMIVPPVALLMSAMAVASPSIEKVTITNSHEIVISGKGFGQGPQVALYDSFSKAANNNGELTLKPELGEWYSHSNKGALTTGGHGTDSQAIVARDSQTSSSVSMVFGIEDENGVHGLKHFQEVFFSFDLKDEAAYPGSRADGDNHSLPSSSATKDAWMMFGHRGDNTSYSVENMGEPSGHDLYIPAWTGGGFIIAGNNTPVWPRFNEGTLTHNWAFGDWVTMMFHAKLDPEDPYGKAEGFFSFMNKNTYSMNTREGTLMTDQSDEGVPYPYWDRIKFNAWARASEIPVKRLYDNIYVAMGDNANARVVIANAKDLNKATRMVHLLPTSWESGKIKATTPPLDKNRPQYVHIITSANENSGGKKLCFSCPKPPIKLIAE
ncbi:MAG: hypothetical protein EA349_15060 [Halomonadaceae bacterium]|nr:MAG: hypothetical protein EA349_15060 [Halomonadaceae bacterium]